MGSSDQESNQANLYAVTLHNAVKRFLRNHPDLNKEWDRIVREIQLRPKLGPRIDHLKGDWFCSYRWNEGNYRIEYEVIDTDSEIHIYDANNRGDVYKRRSGSARRR